MENRATAGGFAAVLESEGLLVDSVTPLLAQPPVLDWDRQIGARMVIGRIESGGHTIGFELTLFFTPALCAALGMIDRQAGDEVPVVFSREPAGVLRVRPVMMGALAMTMRRNGGAFLILPWYHMDDSWLACPVGRVVEYQANIVHQDAREVQFVGVKPKEVTCTSTSFGD
jgi:hypothetical protein